MNDSKTDDLESTRTCMSHGLLADNVDMSLASLLYSCK